VTDAAQKHIKRSDDHRAGLSGPDSLQRGGDVYRARPGVRILGGHGGE